MASTLTVDADKQSFAFIDRALSQAELFGVRRLVVLSGAKSWCFRQASCFADRYPGDWLWVSDSAPSKAKAIPASKVNTLLGQELRHAIFDATDGLNADALAAISGTLVAGSLLVLLVPEWSVWQESVDHDSLRWSEKAHPITTPNFIRHVKQRLAADKTTIFWREGQRVDGALLSVRPRWRKSDGGPTAQQQQLLTQLLDAGPDYYVLTADRGRGKSALAGMLAAQWPGDGECWLTGPNRASASGVSYWSNDKARFIAPDKLLELCQRKKPANVDWLIVDEAAAIPTPLLYRLLPFFERILFTTTVLGYEGTGRGFLLKFCHGLPHWQKLTLSSPIRWADNDPLENALNDLLLFDAENDCDTVESGVERIVDLSQTQLSDDLSVLRQFYGLLAGAHYRTSPLDLRRLLDAPDMRFQAALNAENNIVGALWSVKEGGLTATLAHEVWAGRRRPRGSLVAQSLSAHAGLYRAPLLRSVRVSRIAVQAEYRRRGVARRLIERLAVQLKSEGIDYLSVSFGYTNQLWHFWRRCGFSLIHIGSQKEASSGCYAAMAIMPLTPEGEALLTQGVHRFQRDRRLWTAEQNGLSISAPTREIDNDITELDESDWRELAGFAFAHRTLESAYCSLQRLSVSDVSGELTSLALYIEHKGSIAELAQYLNISGKKELVKLLRAEVGRALYQRNFAEATRLFNWVTDSPSA